jgi:hypothetical protein
MNHAEHGTAPKISLWVVATQSLASLRPVVAPWEPVVSEHVKSFSIMFSNQRAIKLEVSNFLRQLMTNPYNSIYCCILYDIV